jgi:toxin-antitoxin system PIN domain toxin
MRSLLDVNVLIALLDSDHMFHRRAREWLETAIGAGWASCPITHTGFVRVISNPRYQSGLTTPDAFARFAKAANTPHHEHWACDIPLTDPAHLDFNRILGPNQITDVYLLALATAHQGRLVTFDQRIALEAAPQARPWNLLVL